MKATALPPSPPSPCKGEGAKPSPNESGKYVTDQVATLEVETFERALDDIRTRVFVSVAPSGLDVDHIPNDLPHLEAHLKQAIPRIAIAYSGGLDSSVLLHLAHEYAVANGIALFAFHIHHGLSAHADAWLTHCEAECARLKIVFAASHIHLVDQDKSGIEEAARISRYAALGDLCREHGVPLLLTAHHQDDQAETVLLQLMRGSGVAGLSGMETANAAPDLLGDASLIMGRPLLAVSRLELEAFAATREIKTIEDESNSDPRYARNALRHQVMPSLAKCFPGFQQRVARTAAHAQAAQRLLIELAAQDLASCQDGACLDINQFRKLSADRIDNLLRYWFATRGIRMPSTAWLHELRTQLLEAKNDAQLCVTHADCHVRRHRNRVFITPKLPHDSTPTQAQQFIWNGEEKIHFSAFGGTLYFAPAEQGVDADWLRGKTLSMKLRSGGERLKLAMNRSTKSLKYHYQAFDIPAWEREYLPLVTVENQLLFAAGIGMDCNHFSQGPGLRMGFRWQSSVD